MTTQLGGQKRVHRASGQSSSVFWADTEDSDPGTCGSLCTELASSKRIAMGHGCQNRLILGPSMPQAHLSMPRAYYYDG